MSVRRQHQRLGIQELGPVDDFIVLDADGMEALADGVDADALQRVHEGAERVREVEVIVDLVQGRTPC